MTQQTKTVTIRKQTYDGRKRLQFEKGLYRSKDRKGRKEEKTIK